jgi:hypothetical protein
MYPFVRQIYRRLSAISVVGTLFSVGSNISRELMSHTLDLTDQKTLKPEDVDRIFI